MDLRVVPWWVVALAAIALLAIAGAARRAWARWRIRARLARAARGEDRAAAILARRGYAILARQHVVRWEVHVDGERIALQLRADYLVARGRRRFVAEVKTGGVATVESAATRRQLLEYSFAFGTDGVLLVDADRERVMEVVFAAVHDGA